MTSHNSPRPKPDYAYQDSGRYDAAHQTDSRQATSPLRPPALRPRVRSPVSPTLYSANTLTALPTPISPLTPSPSQSLPWSNPPPTHDPALHKIHQTLTTTPAYHTGSSTDTSLPALLHLLHLKLSVLPDPQELASLSTRIRSTLSTLSPQAHPSLGPSTDLSPNPHSNPNPNPNTNTNTNTITQTLADILTKHTWRLQKEKEELELLVKMGADLLRREESGKMDGVDGVDGAGRVGVGDGDGVGGMFGAGAGAGAHGAVGVRVHRTERQAWWFVVRTLLGGVGEVL